MEYQRLLLDEALSERQQMSAKRRINAPAYEVLLALAYQILLKLDGAKCGHMIYLRRGISLPSPDPPVDLALPKLAITKFSYRRQRTTYGLQIYA